MKRICTICARGGSKGLSNKNILPLFGKPLIAHTIIQAQESKLFDKIVVSSDSHEILQAAKECGVDEVVVRPAELATDTASKLPAIQHAVDFIEKKMSVRFGTVVELDATSPLRQVQDIINAVELMESRGVTNVITAAPSRHSPYFNLVERDKNGAVYLSKKPEKTILRRQDAPQCYDMNASIYVWQRAIFMKAPAVFYSDTLLYEMPRERSVDIDSDFDFEIVKSLMGRQMQENK